MATLRWAGAIPATDCPPMKTSPDSGSSRPDTMRSVVVLPAPVGPKSTTKEPSGMTISKASSAVVDPYFLVMVLRMTSATIENLLVGFRQKCLAGFSIEDCYGARIKVQANVFAQPD